MNKLRKQRYYYLSLVAMVVSLLFLSCHSSKRLVYDEPYFRQLALAGTRLGIDIGEHDNHALLLLCSHWLGTPYKYGGKNSRGIDCSAFTQYVYDEIYGVKLSPISDLQYTRDTKHVSKKWVQQGDLVFFASPRNYKVCNHVGIYLADNRFVHASTSSGVIVSNLGDKYWRKRWIGVGRVPQSNR